MAGEPYALSHCVFPWLSHLKKGLRFKGQTTPVPCDGGLSPSKPHTRLQGPAVHGRNDRDRPWMDEAYRISKGRNLQGAPFKALYLMHLGQNTLEIMGLQG